MQKTTDGYVGKDLKENLEDIEMNSEIERAKVIDVEYPDKTVDYNESFTITLVFELLNNKRENVSVYCPKVERYDNSMLDKLQKYTGFKINEFAKENVELPIRFRDGDLSINYKEIDNQLNSNKESGNLYVMTQYGSRIILSIVSIHIFISNSFYEISFIAAILLLFILLFYWYESYFLNDYNFRLVDSIKK